ncbi:MAG TPA: isoaspartyl peptidase/L-asparaginase [Thermoanaerobaculia bacterium]|nr:isoaspartyl peptidase/L-asparaginase [Thermoanaerobaculia bacterium]
MQVRRLPLFLIAFLTLAPVMARAASAQTAPTPPAEGGKAEIVLRRSDAADPAASARWAIAIHGGAGVIEKTMPEPEKREYVQSLEAALKIGRDVLAAGGTSLDAVEKVVRFLEDDPRFNAGKGAVFTHDGTHELDAAIMDGRDLSCGSVAGLKTVRNPVSLARLVMERSEHVFFVGDGAERFADQMKVERVDQKYFFTQRRHDQWQEALQKERQGSGDASPDRKRGTVGAAALDVHGNLAAATSTGGMTNKRFGRLGDVPIIGAGTYANNRTAAISATGWGEKFIRHTVAHDISALMEYGGLTLQQAADRVIHGKLDKGDGGIVAVARDGSIALVFNSEGMFRGAADAGGRFEVRIWE